jgi:hypothetical protein
MMLIPHTVRISELAFAQAHDSDRYIVLLTLLSNHDCEGGEGCSSDTGNGEELDEAGDVVALANDLLLDFKLAVDVVQVAGGLEWAVAEPQQGLVRLGVSVLLCSGSQLLIRQSCF